MACSHNQYFWLGGFRHTGGPLYQRPEWFSFLGSGGRFLWGFTTFSSFSVEIAAILKTQEYFDAVSFLTSSVLGGLAAYQIGKFVIRQTKAQP